MILGWRAPLQEVAGDALIAEAVAAAAKSEVAVPVVDLSYRYWGLAFLSHEFAAFEELVGRIDDLVIHPVTLRSDVGRALFNAIEKEARKLECEVLLLFVPNIASTAAVTFYQSVGFQRRLLHDIPLPWQQAAEDFTAENHFVMARQLRDLVMKPI